MASRGKIVKTNKFKPETSMSHISCIIIISNFKLIKMKLIQRLKERAIHATILTWRLQIRKPTTLKLVNALKNHYVGLIK